jgi:peptide/nickel transport system permease protein
LVAVVGLVALLAPSLAPYDPLDGDLLARLQPPAWAAAGSARHWLGTDPVGRDLLSRLIFGARVSLIVGLSSAVVAATIGVTLGVLAGFHGGSVDRAISLVTDVMMAFPLVLLALAVVALLGPSLLNMIVVFAATSWFLYARMARGATLSLREREFVTAARAAGAPEARIIARHVLPNLVGPVIVVASFEVARVIVTEAALGFLGLGVPPPSPSWGSMLAEGREFVQTAWWVSVFPGVALMTTALGVNFLGDGLRDLTDPTLRT